MSYRPSRKKSPVRMMLLSFFTIRSFFFILLVHPSSVSWPRDIRLALFKSLNILVFCDGSGQYFDNGIYPTILPLIVVELGTFTGKSSYFWILCSASTTSSLKKWLDKSLSAFTIHTILVLFCGGFIVRVTFINEFI